MNLGILLTRGKLYDPPAEFFQCRFVLDFNTGEEAYKMMPKLIRFKNMNVRKLHEYRNLVGLRVAAQLNKDPLSKKELKEIRDVLAPTGPDLLQSKSQDECLAAFLARIGFIFRYDDEGRFKRKDKLARKVIKFGNDPKRRDTVFSIWTAMQSKQSVLSRIWGKMKRTKEKKKTP
ncbi:hypothetical protein DFH11DRAFT_1316310 [Phellopilus nigrolimitatus]|nr:hypothetical protein DFH11DRAFT_1316310 [Phellopilus nigrolimitatus]